MSIIFGILAIIVIGGVGFYFYKKHETSIDAKAETLKTKAQNTANTTKTDIKNDVNKW